MITIVLQGEMKHHVMALCSLALTLKQRNQLDLGFCVVFETCRFIIILLHKAHFGPNIERL